MALQNFFNEYKIVAVVITIQATANESEKNFGTSTPVRTHSLCVSIAVLSQFFFFFYFLLIYLFLFHSRVENCKALGTICIKAVEMQLLLFILPYVLMFMLNQSHPPSPLSSLLFWACVLQRQRLLFSIVYLLCRDYSNFLNLCHCEWNGALE